MPLGRCNSHILGMTFFRQDLGKFKKYWCRKANFSEFGHLFPTQKSEGAFIRINWVCSETIMDLLKQDMIMGKHMLGHRVLQTLALL